MKYYYLLLATFFATLVNAQENFNITVRSNYYFADRSLANIWGYADDQGNEYALVGTSKGLTIVDVTNPELPLLKFEVPGVESFWREVRTWNGYAYVTSEGTNSGLTIIDLRGLPDAIDYKVYYGDGEIENMLSSSHALHIDDGYLYLYGANYNLFFPGDFNGGVIFLDLTDPWNPVYKGKFTERYVHDGYVRNDTLYACNVYNGYFTVVDVTDKSAPRALVRQDSPGGVTHNSWLSDDGKTVFITDENSDSYLTAYDIRDLNNIRELDRFQTAPGTGAIVHNTHILNDYAVTSWYTEGVVIVDVARPHNMVDIGKYDFSPFDGDGFHGCWGVYPYLPSGNIIASDIEYGLYVLTPEYKRACYLEGVISDLTCGEVLQDVTITLNGKIETSRADGSYATGTADAGNYEVLIQKPGFADKTVQVNLQNGVVTYLDITLESDVSFSFSGNITSEEASVPDALVSLASDQSSFIIASDTEGAFNRCGVIPGDYTIVSGKWGYKTICEENVAIQAPIEREIELTRGYYDDFQFNFGWTVSGTAVSGNWVRAIPYPTYYLGFASNPGIDASGDCNGYAFVTGNLSNDNPGEADVDDGYTRLTSPAMDLSTYVDPFISFERWFYNGGGTGAPVDDTLQFNLIQDGVSYRLKNVTAQQGMSQWVNERFRVLDFLPDLSSPVYFEAIAMDIGAGHLVEAGLDLFKVEEEGMVGVETFFDSGIEVLPNPSGDYAEIRWNSDDVRMIKIADLSGRTLEEVAVENQRSFNPGTRYSPGIYMIQLYNSGQLIGTAKWVKK